MSAIADIQSYLIESALSVDVPVIENKEFGATVSSILDLTTQRMKKLLD